MDQHPNAPFLELAGPPGQWSPRSAPAASERLLRSVRSHWLLALTVTTAISSAGIALTLSLTPAYKATAVVSVNPMAPDPLTPATAAMQPRLDDGIVETTAAALKSRETAARVVDALGIGKEPAKPGLAWTWGWQEACGLMPDLALCAPVAAPPLNARVEGFLRDLTVDQIGRSRALNLSYVSPDPQVAANALNMLIAGVRDQEVQRQAEDVQRTATWLEQRSDELRIKWRGAEDAASEFRRANHLTQIAEGGQVQSLALRQMANVANDYSKAQAELAQATARNEAQRRALQGGDRQAALTMSEQPTIVAMTNALSEQYARRASLAQRYGQNYPDVQALGGSIAQAEQRLAVEVGRAQQSVAHDLGVKSALVAQLGQSLSAMRKQNDELGGKDVELLSLVNEAADARLVYQTFLDRAKQVSNRVTLLQPSVQVISRATAPDQPSFPVMGRFLGASVLLGLLSGLGAAVLRENATTGFKQLHTIADNLGLPLLASIPWVNRSRRRGAAIVDYVASNPFSVTAEAVRSLAARIVLAHGGTHQAISVALTSATATEGKSTLAVWLGRSIAEGGRRVLLIEGDHRAGNLRSTLGLWGQAGLSDWLAGKKTFDDVVQHDERTGLDVVVGGEPMTRAFGSNEVFRLRKLLDELKLRYDLVIIDTPPLLAMSEGLLFASVADQTMFVCRWGHTRRTAAWRAIERLRTTGARLTGVVTTMVDAGSITAISDEYRPADLKLLARYNHPRAA